jgi:hypothetical protein
MALFFPQCWVSMRVVFDGLGEEDSKELILPMLQPREANIGLNGYNLADTFEVQFHADVLPISPELIRAVGLDIYLFQTDKLETDPRPHLNEINRIITGIVDEWGMDYSGGGRFIRGTGRDYTALLIDKKWLPTDIVELGDDLAVTVQNLLDKYYNAVGRRGKRLKAVYSSERPAPVVGSVAEGIVKKTTLHRRGPKPKPKTSKGRSKVVKKRWPVPTGRSYWDVIYELCLSHGFIAYIDGESVIIHEPQSLSDESSGRALHYAFGHNLKTLDISRKLTNHAAPQVVASFYDQKAKTFVEVRFPDDDTALGEKKRRATGVGGNTIHFRRVVPPKDIADVETMKAFLSAAYHMYGRSEASVKFSTKWLRGLENPKVPDADTDLCRLRPGGPIALGWDSVGRVDFHELSREERWQRLMDEGYSQQVARVIADNYDKIDSLRRPFYTKAANFHYSIADGLNVEVEAINYINPKRDEAKT